MQPQTLATLAALLGYTIFGFSFLFSTVALEQATPLTLLSLRFLVAFAALNLIFWARKIRFDVRGKPVKMLLLLGLVEPVIYFLCENYGISMTSTSFSGVIIGTIPVFGLIGSRIFLKESISTRQCLCAACSLFGVALTTVGGTLEFSSLGVILLFLAAISASLFNVISRSIAPHFTALERTYIMSALGSSVFTILALLENRNDLSALFLPLQSPSFWMSLIYLSLVSSIGAFFLLNYANNYISASTVSLFTNFTTVISILAGIFIMGDRFTLPQLCGIAIILVSMLVVSLPTKATAQ